MVVPKQVGPRRANDRPHDQPGTRVPVDERILRACPCGARFARRCRMSEITNLTAPERETVITMNDADDHMTVWTAQRPLITKLRANPVATLVDEGYYGSTVWAQFTLPADMLTLRSGKRKVSDEQRAAAAERMKEMHARKKSS